MCKFTDAVERNTRDYDSVCPIGREMYFSWQQCDTCGTTLGGDREEAIGLRRDHETEKFESIDLEICLDCVLFFANAETPADRLQEWRAVA